MRRPDPSPALPFAIGAVLLAALGALAILQYRWTAQLSASERERLRSGVEASATRFADGLPEHHYAPATLQERLLKAHDIGEAMAALGLKVD